MKHIVGATPAVNCVVIEHISTTDLPDGQPALPEIECDAVWRVVNRGNGRTLWRRIFLSSTAHDAATRSAAFDPAANNQPRTNEL